MDGKEEVKNRFSNLNLKPIHLGIDPPAHPIVDYSIPDQQVEYPPCRKCGAAHKMGVKEMATGKIDPMNICYDCFWIGAMKPITEQVVLKYEIVADDPEDQHIANQMSTLLKHYEMSKCE